MSQSSTPTPANAIQVGGDHYKAPEGGQEHWDRMVQLFGWPGARPYFVGCTTAYIERYWKKEGIKDLKKAIHFLQKIIELEEKHTVVSTQEDQSSNRYSPPDIQPLSIEDMQALEAESARFQEMVRQAEKEQNPTNEPVHFFRESYGTLCDISPHGRHTTYLFSAVTCPDCNRKLLENLKNPPMPATVEKVDPNEVIIHLRNARGKLVCDPERSASGVLSSPYLSKVNCPTCRRTSPDTLTHYSKGDSVTLCGHADKSVKMTNKEEGVDCIPCIVALSKRPSYPANPRYDNGRLACGCWGEKCEGHEETPIGEAS